VGFALPSGDPDALSSASGLIGSVAEDLAVIGGQVLSTAAAMMRSWRGDAALAYQELSRIIGAHFHAAADTSAAAQAALKGYSAELHRCQQEGMSALRQAERCLDEIKTQRARLDAAQQAGSGAESALSAAHKQGSAARAAGPSGLVAAAAADANAAAAQTALSAAQQAASAASVKLQSAEHELAVWQGRGRRAWEDAQSAADRASGSLQALAIIAPPLAGSLPWSATAPFAQPGDVQCGEEPGDASEPGIPDGPLVTTIGDFPPWTEDFPGREPTPGDGLHGDRIPDAPPWTERFPGEERTPGGNITDDPAGEPCGRQQVGDRSPDDLPARGAPGSSGVRDDGQGNGQIRDYGPDGRAVKDYDFGHDHNGAGDPHAHDWDWSKRPARQPARPIGQNEP
jgi:uncharacterized protein YukE